MRSTRRSLRRRLRNTRLIRRSRHRGPYEPAQRVVRRPALVRHAASHRTDRPPMSAIDVRIPDIGDFSDIPVIEVLVKEGDSVAIDDSLVTLESDKATMDVPSPAAGTVRALRVKPGDKVSAGTVVLTLDAGAVSPHEAPVAGTLSAAPHAENETPAPRGEKGRADAP